MSDEKYIANRQMGPYPNVMIILLLSFFPVVGIALGVISVYNLYFMIVEGWSVWGSLCFFVWIMGFACLFVILGWVFFSAGLSQYRFAEEGIYAKYPFRKMVLIPWKDFQQVCICYASYKPKPIDVICCVKHGETYSAYGRWKTDNPFKYKSVIVIPYTPLLVEGIREKCPYEVLDLRNTVRYPGPK